MRALIHTDYGSPDGASLPIELRELDDPTPRDGEVLVRVRAVSINPIDWHFLTGTPYVARLAFGLRKPRSGRLGHDLAGTVEAVGSGVARVRTGEDVYGAQTGSFAELLSVPESNLATKPANLSFEQAAAVPVAGLTALQALRDKGKLLAGQMALIHGASGGVGTFAVQLAKVLGAEVTGVCSTANVDLVRSLGADRVVDYTREDFTRGEQRFDLLLDLAGGRSWSDLRRVLAPRATVVLIGGPKANRWLAPLDHWAKVMLASVGSGRKVVPFLAHASSADLTTLEALFESGAIQPVIERRYDLSEAAQAFAHVGKGHARGKVVLSFPGGT
jgi:NADPH:quinone reductase-like Zn-dependent oxidoreductase